MTDRDLMEKKELSRGMGRNVAGKEIHKFFIV